MTSGLRTEHRLWAAVLLCLVPLGLKWSATAPFFGIGTTIYGSCTADGYCTPDYYIPGYFTPGTQTLVAQSPARVFLVLAAVALASVATRTRTTRTLRLARLATAGVVLTAVLAAANGVILVLVCTGAATALLLPLVGPRAGFRAVLAGGQVRR